MHPLTTEELGADFSLGSSIRYGHLPTIYSEPDPADYLAIYRPIFGKKCSRRD